MKSLPDTIRSTAADAAFAWGDQFLLGHQAMDDTHREFVETVGAMLAAGDAGFEPALEAFCAHAERHFGEEDAWMRETAFPAAGCHIDEHAAVMTSAREVRQRVRAGDLAIGRAFARELANWFPGHADHLDSALAAWMVQRRHGGRPVVVRRPVSLQGHARHPQGAAAPAHPRAGNAGQTPTLGPALKEPGPTPSIEENQ